MDNEQPKVQIFEVEQALVKALKNAAEAGYECKYDGGNFISNPLDAVNIYSQALQRILSAQNP